MKNAPRDWTVFALVQAAVCLAVYGSALWGSRLLVPLDIAPAIFPAYRFVDPLSNGVPDNHYIIDQLIYDLPLQTVIYEAYRRGEIPWWDPFTYGGRPLLADAHINGTDPIRILCYLTLPFELAYNWNLVLHYLVAAAGMFALLRFWRFGLFICTTLAVAWQFSGAFILHFGHPWIAGTFVWFPFIWIFWEKALIRGPQSARDACCAAILCGAAFYSGNLQSHTYLPIFALIFLLGHISTGQKTMLRAAIVVAASGALGAALAAPVLANQVEFFLLSTREVATTLEWWQHPVKVLLSLGGIYPWATGTFRTIDAGRVVRSSGVSWLTFCGSAIFALAFVALIWRRMLPENQRPLLTTAACLIAAYLVIAGTPLAHIFYLRIAPLAVLGLVPLAAIGLQLLLSPAWVARPKLGVAAAGTTLCVIVALNALALAVYPGVKDHLMQAAMVADSANTSFPAGAASLRRFQIENFPNEVSLRNPEASLSLVGLLLISAALGTSSEKSRRRLANSAVIVSLLPLLNFAGRFLPDHPVEMLHRLRAGGPAQQQAISLVRENNGRILDREMQIFPYAMGAFYRIHTIHGYSALQPASIFHHSAGMETPDGYGADFAVGLSDTNQIFVQRLSSAAPSGRFPPVEGAPIKVISETLNSLTLSPTGIAPYAFYRSDTAYPGWRLFPEVGTSARSREIETLIQVSSGGLNTPLHLLYWPLYFSVAILIAIAAGCFLAVLAAISTTASVTGRRRHVHRMGSAE